MSKLRVDYLQNHPDYKVVQHEDMYHFNTDTCLLGEFIKINKGDKVLDVGTNNGALLVFIINKGGIACGIEINKQALEIAKLTLKENNFEATLINQDFKTYLANEKYDVIVSNPPYFSSKEEKQKNQNEHLKIARHEEMLDLKSLCVSIANNLKEDGIVYLVHRPNRLDDIEKNLNEVNLYINEYQLVYDYRKKEAKSLLIKASFNKDLKIKLDNKIIGG